MNKFSPRIDEKGEVEKMKKGQPILRIEKSPELISKSVRLPPEMWAKLQEIAERKNKSVNTIINLIVEFGLEHLSDEAQ